MLTEVDLVQQEKINIRPGTFIMLHKIIRNIVLITVVSCLMLTGCSSSKKVDELRLQGIEELQKAKYSQAIETLNKALELSDGKVSSMQFDILMYRAEAEYMSGDFEAAQKTIDTLREVDGDKETYMKFQTQLDAKKFVTDASEALNNGDTDTAKQKIDEAKAAGIANDRDLLFDEIVYYEKTARWQDAYNAVKAYLEQYPGDEDAERELSFLQTRIDALEDNQALAAMTDGAQ